MTCVEAEPAPSPHRDYLCTFPSRLNDARRDSRKPRWRCACSGEVERGEHLLLEMMEVCFSFLLLRTRRKPDSQFLPHFTTPILRFQIKPPLQHPWVIDYPDCELLGYLIQHTLRQSCPRGKERARWPCSWRFCLWGWCPNRDLGSEGTNPGCSCWNRRVCKLPVHAAFELPARQMSCSWPERFWWISAGEKMQAEKLTTISQLWMSACASRGLCGALLKNTNE